MTEQSYYLTEESLKSLQVELENLRNKTIPDIAKRIDEAKQQGDLSENAEYHQAREDMSWAQGRVMEVEHIIQNAQLIHKQSKTETVTVGSTVKVLVNHQEKAFTIVGPQEVNLNKGLISNESPIGQALLGHKKGDKVKVTVPAGVIEYEIKAIQ